MTTRRNRGATAGGHDVVVVGGGSAGCVVARRLADAGARVLLLEAGPGRPLAHDLRADRAPPALDDPRAVGISAVLAPGRHDVVVRGRGLGGSSVVNGGNFCWPTPADVADWDAPGWDYRSVSDALIRAETDPGGAGERHGRAGPIPVSRPDPALIPGAARFLSAAQRLGYPFEEDKNDAGPVGAGVVPTNVRAGARIDAATAYLGGDRSGIEVRVETTARRIRLNGSRAIGVAVSDGSLVRADRVVLAAGAVATPTLLVRSGIGPAETLRSQGISTIVDLPVGIGGRDHPAVFVPFESSDPALAADLPASPVSLETGSGTGADDLQVMAFLRPFADRGPLHLMCAVTAPDSTVRLAIPREGQVQVEYRYLAGENDRRRLRMAVRLAARLLDAGVGRRVAPSVAVLADDDALDAWSMQRIATTVHLCGTAPLGPVLDPSLRVHGVDGLWVADTSALPSAPRRGPWASAVAVGELAASFVRP